MQKDVLDRVSKLSPPKLYGMKDICTMLIKTAIPILIVEFTHLCNLIIDTGIFSEDWKLATVTPIHKIRNPKYCSELRPISILPLPGKVIEQIIHDQIKTFRNHQIPNQPTK